MCGESFEDLAKHSEDVAAGCDQRIYMFVHREFVVNDIAEVFGMVSGVSMGPRPSGH